MSLLWMESFDIYGPTGNEGKMLDGLWSAIPSIGTSSNSASLSSVRARTGTYSYAFFGATALQTIQARRIFGSTKTAVGVGFAFYAVNLPATSNEVLLLRLADANNATQIAFYLQTDGGIAVTRGNNSASLAISNPAITAAAWNHVEIFAVIGDGTDGAFEVRVNEVTILNVTGVDTKDSATPGVAQMAFGGRSSSQFSGTYHWDDMFAWDTLGTENNTFIGDRRVFTFLPDVDGPEQDWIVFPSGPAYAAVNETPPNDATTYVGTAVADAEVSFGFPSPPKTTVSVSAIQAMARSLKTDAGTADLMTSLRSGGSVANADPRPITTAWTYWFDMFPTDPATGAPWTPASLANVEMILTRTSA